MASRKVQRKAKKRQAALARKAASATPPEGGLLEFGQAEKERLRAEQAHQAQQAEGKLAEARAALEEAEAARRDREALLSEELPPAPPVPGATGRPGGLMGLLRGGVRKTRESLTEGMAGVVLGKKAIDGEVLERLEELLITADMGLETASRLLRRVEQRVRRKRLGNLDQLKSALAEEIRRIMSRDYPPPALEGKRPAVVLFVGVNGSGKTTTIGKLAAQHTRRGKRVLLAAGDTFRAAAAEQLAGWAERAGCGIVSRAAGADPSSVMHQAVRQGLDEEYDLVLCDTAGRMHTKLNLMEELKKIKRVIGNVIPDAPHETWLVLDANTGQNAILQTREFHRALGVSGLIVTKLDGTARGGVVVGIVNEFDLPIRYIGVGEGVDDLEPFDPADFAESLLD